MENPKVHFCPHCEEERFCGILQGSCDAPYEMPCGDCLDELEGEEVLDSEVDVLD
jgi:hypothetical protein